MCPFRTFTSAHCTIVADTIFSGDSYSSLVSKRRKYDAPLSPSPDSLPPIKLTCRVLFLSSLVFFVGSLDDFNSFLIQSVSNRKFLMDEFMIVDNKAYGLTMYEKLPPCFNSFLPIHVVPLCYID
mmetsp:Transcript_43950/g.65188  ORF Transcript_43950/g.65188 Transcript_43950/m.65188 type:complete len:125 (+) Transcript_43950:216-590(+)